MNIHDMQKVMAQKIKRIERSQARRRYDAEVQRRNETPKQVSPEQQHMGWEVQSLDEDTVAGKVKALCRQGYDLNGVTKRLRASGIRCDEDQVLRLAFGLQDEGSMGFGPVKVSEPTGRFSPGLNKLR
jgi:hypothetical protein